MKKRFFWCCVLFVLSALFLCSCDKGNKQQEIDFEKKTIILRQFMSETVALNGISGENVEFYVTDDEILAINPVESGVECLGLGVGKATILATFDNDCVFCTVIVLPAEYDIELMLAVKEKINLEKGATYQLEPVITYNGQPFNLANVGYEITVVSPQDCISVDVGGKITAEKKGFAKIKLTAYCYGVESSEVFIEVYCYDKDNVNPGEIEKPRDGLIEDVFD